MPAYADNILLKFKSADRKMIAILLPVIVGALLGGNMFMKPLFKKIKSVDAEKSGYAEKEAVYKNIVDWDKKLSPYRAQDGKDTDKTALIEQLNSFAGKSGLTILSISPDEKKILLSNVESMLIRIDAEGNYHQASEFISLAESIKTHTRVSSFEINREGGLSVDTPGAPAGEANKSKTYKISLSLMVYFGIKE
jgi:Tfp pilus assembly protein PilO